MLRTTVHNSMVAELSAWVWLAAFAVNAIEGAFSVRFTDFVAQNKLQW